MSDGKTPVPAAVDPATGALITEGGGGGGLSVTDGASFTPGTSQFTPSGGQYNTTPSQLTSGDQGTFALSQNRSLFTANEFPAAGTATWTTATSLNAELDISTIGLGTVMVSTVETGTTTTAGALTFEVYDGTNWIAAVNGQQVGNFTLQSTYTLVNNTNVAWTFDVAGFQKFRVRLSTAITGTGSPQVVVIAQAMAATNDIAPSVGWAQQLDQTNDAISSWEKGYTYTKVTSSAQVSASSCVLAGYTCESIGTAGTLILYDNTAGSGNTVSGGTVTLAAGIYIFAQPIILTTGCYAATTGTPTVNVITRALSK
jgi:hypothetical protein